MEFGQGDPRVYLLNIETGQREIVGNFPGMSFSPRFSPDGQRVIMSLQQGGNSNLFVMDLRSKINDAADRHAGDRHLAVLFAGRQQIVLRVRPRRQAADLCDGGDRRRRRSASPSARAPIPRRCGRRAAISSPSPSRAADIRHRHHEARRLGRTHPHLGLSQRRPDLCAERPRPDVLPRSRRQRRAVAVHGRHFRPQRTAGADAGFASDPAWSPLLS